jgi:hypothetical protein
MRDPAYGSRDESDSTDVVPVEDPRFPKTELASKAAERAAARTADDETPQMLTCGDFGGLSKRKVTILPDDEDGEETTEIVLMPCAAPSCFGLPGVRAGIEPGKCFRHTDVGLTKTALAKARFLDAFIKSPELGIGHACETLGMKSRANIYWWRDSDAEFKQNLAAIQQIAEAIVTDQVEEMVVQAIREWRPGAGVLAQWYLANRRSGRWKTAAKAAGDDGQGRPQINVSGGQNVWMIGDHREPM